ncbi:MAG: C45 family autoproteolytic acyltransferase/hydrolase [Pseudomonadota bacterium]
MKKSKALFLLFRFICILLLLAGCTDGGGSSAPNYESTISRMTTYIQNDMAQNQVTGLSIALVDGQKVVWARGFGYADKEAGVLAGADTIYEIGSLSKTFAAMAVMRLVEEGLIDLDQPLTTYLPGFYINQRFPESGPITIRSMLTHHSGIPGDLFNGAFTEGGPFDYDTWLLEYLRNEYTSAPVDAVLAYSNSAVELLRPVIEKVAPGGFKAYANDLFDRMGMANTSYELDERIPLERLSNAYDGGVLLPLLYGNLGTAGSIRSSVLDMTRYIKTIHAGGTGPGGQVLSRASLEQMFTRQNGDVPLDFDLPVGLTWFLATPDYYGGLRVEHEGATAWFHAMIRILYDHQLGVIVLSNTSASNVEEIAVKTLEYALQEKAGITRPPDPVPPFSPPDTSWTQDQLEALAGTYVMNTSGNNFATVLVRVEKDGLFVDGQPDRWIPRQNGYFSLPGDNPVESQRSQYRFHTVAGRFVMSTLLANGAEILRAERYDQGAISDAWVNRQGAYTATNINPGSELWPGTNTLALEVGSDHILRLKGTLRENISIKPLTDTLAIIGGIGRNRGESVRVVTVDGEEQIELWGFRYRKTLETLGTFEGGTLYRTTGAGGAGRFNVIQLNGDWRQMGRQYGHLLTDQMGEFYDLAVARLMAGGATYEDLRLLGQGLYDKQFAYVRELIDGMAEGSGMSLEKQQIVAGLMGGLFGCSSMDAWGEYTGQGALVVGRNWDTERGPFDGYGRFLTVVVYNPPTPQNSVADINYVGSLSMQTGMNSKGIFLDLQSGTLSDPQAYADRTPGAFQLFSFLLNASSPKEISALFQSTPANMGLIINGAFGSRLTSLDTASVYEWATYHMKQRDGKGLLASSNYFTDPSWENLPPVPDGLAGGFSKERLANLLFMGEQHKGSIDVPRMMEIYDTTIPYGGPTFPDDSSLATIYQMVAVPAHGTLWLKARDYSGWERMDLQPLFLR